MKKFFGLVIIFTTLCLSGCAQNISNLDVQTLNEKAEEYMKQGDYENAIARLKSAIDLNSKFPENHFNLGVAYYENKNYEEAIEAFSEALKLKSDFVDAIYSRAIAYEDIAYEIISGEKDEEDNNSEIKEEKTTDKELSNEDKLKIVEFLKNAKTDFEKFIELSKNSQDIEEIKTKISQIDEAIKKYE